MKPSTYNHDDIEKLFCQEGDLGFDGFGFLKKDGVVERVVDFLKDCPDWQKNNFLNWYGTFYEILPQEKTLPLLACFDPEHSLWGQRNTGLVFQYLIFLFQENKVKDIKALLAYPDLQKTAKNLVHENTQLFMNYALARDAVDSWVFLRSTKEGLKYIQRQFASVWSKALSLKSYKVLERLMQEKTLSLSPSERLNLVVGFYNEGSNNQDMRRVLTFLGKDVPLPLFISKAQGSVGMLEHMYEFMDHGQQEEFTQLLTNHPSFWHTLLLRESELGRRCLKWDLQLHVSSEKSNKKQQLGKRM